MPPVPSFRFPYLRTRLARIAPLAGLVMLGGCGAQGGAGAQTPAQLEYARAAAVLATLVRAQRESLDTILADITRGAVTTQTLLGTEPQPLVFNQGGAVAVDMSTASDGHGNLLYPGCTGSITILWSGAATPSAPAGSGGVGSWTVTITAATAVTRQDTVAGILVSIPAGTTMTSTVSVSANRTDANDWTLTADADSTVSSAIAASASNLDGTDPASVSLDGTLAYSYQASESGTTWSSGNDPKHTDGYDWTATVTDPGGPHTVLMQMQPPTIVDSVDGVSLLPPPGTKPGKFLVDVLIDVADLPGWLQWIVS